MLLPNSQAVHLDHYLVVVVMLLKCTIYIIFKNTAFTMPAVGYAYAPAECGIESNSSVRYWL
ncbi:hypothetical protein [Nostoc sp.]|uniref:hypothetical protein n=1 Tax=Nostoc sp. TaxID=1180 RepID=UPI002FFC88C7